MLSVGDIARETGLSRQRVWQLAVAGRIPAKTANPKGKQHRFYDSDAFAGWRKDQSARRSAMPTGAQMPRARRMARRRWERIARLLEIIKNKIEVNPAEKALALEYHDALAELWYRKSMGPLCESLPLLEGVQALHEIKDLFPIELKAAAKTASLLVAIRKSIAQLPTRSASS